MIFNLVLSSGCTERLCNSLTLSTSLPPPPHRDSAALSYTQILSAPSPPFLPSLPAPHSLLPLSLPSPFPICLFTSPIHILTLRQSELLLGTILHTLWRWLN